MATAVSAGSASSPGKFQTPSTPIKLQSSSIRDVPAYSLGASSADEVRHYIEKLIKEVGDEGGNALSTGAVIDHAREETLKALPSACEEFGRYLPDLSPGVRRLRGTKGRGIRFRLRLGSVYRIETWANRLSPHAWQSTCAFCLHPLSLGAHRRDLPAHPRNRSGSRHESASRGRRDVR